MSKVIDSRPIQAYKHKERSFYVSRVVGRKVSHSETPAAASPLLFFFLDCKIVMIIIIVARIVMRYIL